MKIEAFCNNVAAEWLLPSVFSARRTASLSAGRRR